MAAQCIVDTIPADVTTNQVFDVGVGSIVSFENVFNFRDAGGYQTSSGRFVKSGCLFRSGAFSEPTSNDLSLFSDLGIKLVVDLRDQSEKIKKPNKLPTNGQSDSLSLPIWPNAKSDVERALLAGKIREFGDQQLSGEPDTPTAMSNFYRSFIRDYQPVWSQLLGKLCEANTQPVVLHCAGGKDRTGVAVSIVLRTLGVPMDTIIEDYLLTNRAVEKWIAEDHPNGLPSFFHSVMKADPMYLNAAFEQIYAEYGSFDDFLHSGLGFTDLQRAELSEAYLT